MGAELERGGRRRPRRPGRPARRSRAGGRSRSRCGPPSARRWPRSTSDLGAGVEARGGLVEHEDRGVGQGGPGQRHELLLARRQPRAALAHLGVEPSGSAANRSCTPMASSAAVDLGVGGAGARPMRTLSRIVPLNRKPSWGTTTIRSRSDRSVASRRSTPPKRDRALGRVVEPGDSLASVDLPAPVGPDERQPLAGRDRAGRRRAAPAVRRRRRTRRPSTSIVARARAGRPRRRRSATSTGGVEQLEQLVQAGAGRLHHVEQLAELLHRLEQVGEREHEERRRCRW